MTCERTDMHKDNVSFSGTFPDQDQSWQEHLIQAVNVRGLLQIFDPTSRWFRITIWTVLLVASLAFLCFQIANQSMIFAQFPVNVRIDILNSEKLQFPTVSICNYNMVRNSTLSKDGYKRLVENIFPTSFFVSEIPDFRNIPEQVDWANFYHKHAHPMNTTILECTWQTEKCDYRNFTNVFTDMGLCFRFNADGSLQVKNSGLNYGLSLSLNVMQEEYVRGKAGNAAGFKVLVHMPNDAPLMSNMAMGVSPGMNTYVGLKLTKLKQLPWPYGECGEKQLKYTSSYTLSACQLECKAAYFQEKCGCRDIYMPPEDYPICSPKTTYTCLFKHEESFIRERGQCRDVCPDPCIREYFGTDISFSAMSDNFYDQYSSARGMTPEYWRKNYVQLDIYFQEMMYEYVEKQEKYTWMDLLCDIGGALGLFVGASFFSVLEFVDFLIIRLSRRRRRDTVVRSSNDVINLKSKMKLQENSLR